jgi:hypothetical protein
MAKAIIEHLKLLPRAARGSLGPRVIELENRLEQVVGEPSRAPHLPVL